MQKSLFVGVTAIVLAAATSVQSQPPPPNVLIPGISLVQYEVQGWINETDSTNIAVTWRDRGPLIPSGTSVSFSTDAGATWSTQLLPQEFGAYDPCMVGDASGRFYLTVLEGTAASIEVAVYRSTNGGSYWGSPVAVAPPSPNFEYFCDKDFTATDRTGGAYDGNFYVTWTRYAPPEDSARVMFARSTDGGLSFDDSVVVAPPINTSSCGTGLNNGWWSIPIVNSDGSVHVFMQGVHIDSGTCNRVFAARHAYSTDGGVTFTPDEFVLHSDFDDTFIDGGIRVFGAPVGDADISGGPYDGSIYIARTQYAAGSTTEMDIEVTLSTDNGLTWSDAAIVNDDSPGQNIDQFQPWLIVNEEGVIMVTFYDQRNDPVDHTLFDHYFTASFDGGDTYVHNYRLSSVSSTPGFDLIGGAASMVGEYEALDARHDFVFTAWTDRRGTDRDIYSAAFVLPFIRPRLYLPEDNTYTMSTLPSFRWSTCWHEGEDSYRLEISSDPGFSSVDYTFDALSDNDFTPGSPLDSGLFYWRVKAFRAAGDSTEYSEVFALTTGCQSGTPPNLTYPSPGDTVSSTTVVLQWQTIGDADSYRLQLSTTPDFSAMVVDTNLGSAACAVSSLSDLTEYYWRVSTTNPCGTGDWSEGAFFVLLCPITTTGDVNLSTTLTSADIIAMVNFVFKGGETPQPCQAAADINCSGTVTSADIIGMVNFVFKSGAAPCDVCTIIPGMWSCP